MINLATNPKTMGERLRMYRMRKNISTKELARLVGLSPSTINKYENDASVPSIRNLAAITAALDVTISMVMYGREPNDTDEPLIIENPPR